MSEQAPVIVWFGRDLRLSDHPALRAAADSGAPVIPVYVDPGEAATHPLGGASRWWLHRSLERLSADLDRLGSSLVIRRGDYAGALRELVREIGAANIYHGFPVEPDEVAAVTALGESGIRCIGERANLLYEPGSVLTGAGEPYKVFTPFYKACFAREAPPRPLAAPETLLAPDAWPASLTLDELALLPRGFDWAGGLEEAWTPGEAGAQARLDAFVDDGLTTYKVQRDRPDKAGTSRLSPHLRFGEVSARQAWASVHAAGKQDTQGGSAFLRELIWREFCQHLLHFFPQLPDAPLKSDYEAFPWRDSAADLKAWQRGQTGYPIVDAGMRELWHTGWMHNRVRMITASFLVKDLRLDWRHGEAWFWDTLVDADLGNNSAGWQWVAGCGTDAAPYFRIFNPVTQARRFDPDGDYIRRWVPELRDLPDAYLAEPWTMPPPEAESRGFCPGETYPHPVVDHGKARKAALAALDEMKEHARA